MIRVDDFKVEIKPNKCQEWIDIITVTHEQSGKYRWKDCRNTYPNEQNDIIEMLIEILKRELEDEL